MNQMVSSAPAFEHLHAAHCESGVMANMLRHHGVPMSESLAFGLASGLAFAYLPFVKLSGLPLVSYRMPPKAIIKGLLGPLGARFRFQTFGTPEAGQQQLDALLARGQAVGLQTSVYWLPYFPPDMRFHFNAHNLLVYGKEGDEYLISDPVFEQPVRCSAADLARARFAKGALAPKGLMYWPETIARKAPTPRTVLRAIRTNARRLRAPIPLIGVRGMRMLANKLETLAPADPFTIAYIGHLVRMQEEIGTGGAGFRFIYAAFLQEAAQITGRDVLRSFSDRLTAIGDDWRVFALKAARMVKGREPVDPPALAALLRQQAAQEDSFFAELGRAAR